MSLYLNRLFMNFQKNRVHQPSTKTIGIDGIKTFAAKTQLSGDLRSSRLKVGSAKNSSEDLDFNV